MEAEGEMTKGKGIEAIWVWIPSVAGDLASGFKIIEGLLRPDELADPKVAPILAALPGGAVLFLDSIDAHPLPPLKERVEWALKRYEGFYRYEAPESFRKKHPSEPTLEGVLALGNLKGYWKLWENQEAEEILKRLLAEGGR